MRSLAGLRMFIAVLMITGLAQVAVGSGSIPKLISPLDGAFMDNGRSDWRDYTIWDFDWSDVDGATHYQLYVKVTDLQNPMIDAITSSSSYARKDSGYITGCAKGTCTDMPTIAWKVRAQINGQWNEWSEERKFTVEVYNTDPISSPPLSVTTQVPTTPSATPQQNQQTPVYPSEETTWQSISPSQQDSTNYGLIGGVLAIIAIGIVIHSIRRRGRAPRPAPEQPERNEPDILHAGHVLSKSSVKNIEIEESWKPPIVEPEPAQQNPVASPVSVQSSAIPVIASAFGYKGATIQYKVRVENPTSEPIADIKVNLYVPDVFLASESTKSIAMLKPSESKTVTFEIRPTGECGNCEVSGKVVYYDYPTKKTTGIDIPAKSLSIVCPMLKMKKISESQWHSIVSSLIETEESTKDIDMPAETLFTMTSRIVKDMHMHPLNPEITNSQQLFNGVARFYGEGVKGLKYAAQVEVVGGAKKSRLILKTWAEKEEALTGFYHGLLDEIEKRVSVKGYIDDSIVQNFYHYGDKIGTQVKDSIVQRSNIGAGADVDVGMDADTGAGGDVAEKKCLTCGTVAEGNGKFCNECGAKL